MNFFQVCQLLFAVLGIAGSSAAIAQDWPQFRGPAGNGVQPTLQHPVNWGEEQNLAWSVALPGGGLASPVVCGDRVFVCCAVNATPPVSFADGVRDMRPQRPDGPVQFQVVCLSLQDGSTTWTRTLLEQRPEYPIHASNSFATESPATDGERVYVYFAAIGIVAALDLQGNEVWRQEIGAYPTGNGFGSGSSLTIGDGKVFVQCDNDESSFVVAFDGKTGQQAWRQDRSGRTSWSTPLFWENEKRSELITCGSGFVTSYDPQTGAELWTLSGISSAFSASPASDDQRIYFGNSGPRSSGPLLAVSAGMQGNSNFEPNQEMQNLAWSKMQAGPGMSSPVVANGQLYIPGRGILTVYTATDGEVVFKERLPLKSMAASLWADERRVFLMDENGTTLVLGTGPQMEILATNEIDDLFWSTPAVAGDALLLRGVKKLYCIRESR